MNVWYEEWKENQTDRIKPRTTKEILHKDLHRLLPFLDLYEDEFVTIGGRPKIGIAIIDQQAWKIIKEENIKTSKSDNGVWFIVISNV